MTDFTPPSDAIPAIIVGRDHVYARLQQHILDPSDRYAIIYTGHSGTGKTALLHHFSTVFEDPFLSVFTALSTSDYDSPHDLLQYIIDEILVELADANFSLSRVPHIEDAPAATSLHDWFKEVFLPEVFAIIRPHRRIVWLIDDANHLTTFGDEAIAYWHGILTTHHQFAIVMTIHTDQEHTITELVPLVNPAQSDRLHHLPEDSSADLIRRYAPGIDDKIIAPIFTATGGHPRLLTYYGQLLRQHRVAYNDTEALKLAQSGVYEASQADFRALWQKLSRDERLVLTAIASLIYDDPLQTVTPARIERWLVETDYLLDIVTINAALRGLDYRDIVRHNVGENIELTMALMQQWLLEQARLDDDVEVQRGQLPLRLIVLAIVIIVILIALMLWIPPQYLDNTSDIATATLSS